MKKILITIIALLFLVTPAYGQPLAGEGIHGGGGGSVATDSIFTAKGDLAIGTGPNAAAKLTVGGAGTILRVATDTPAWTTATYPATTTVNRILFSSATNVVDQIAVGAEGSFLRWGASPFVPGASTLILPNAAAQGTVLVANTANTVTALGVGTAGQLLRTAGAAANVAWTTPTYPNAATTTGAYMRADGTNFIQSTLILPNAGTQYAIPYYSTANNMGEIANGTTGQVFTATAGAAPAWSSSISIATLDMTSSTSSIPMTVTAVAGAQTANGQMHFDTATEILSIGDGTGRISLDFTGQQTYTFPAASQTLASLAGAETLTNKTLTAPYITAPEVLYATAWLVSEAAYTFTAAEVSRTIINTYGRGAACDPALPTAAAGMTFIIIVGTQHNSKMEILKGASTLYWETAGVPTAVASFHETNQVVGSRASCATFKTGAAAWSWMCGAISGTWATTAL